MREVERLPDPAGSHETGDRLIGAAVEQVDEEWKTNAYVAVVQVANLGAPFSANEVWETGLPLPPNAGGRALGLILRQVSREGFIAKTDSVVRSRLGTSYIEVWRKV